MLELRLRRKVLRRTSGFQPRMIWLMFSNDRIGRSEESTLRQLLSEMKRAASGR
jgi:hypothetical protein